MALSLIMENDIVDYNDSSVLVAVPTHPQDHPDREFNPPDILARQIATHSAIRYVPDALAKVEPNQQKEIASSRDRFDEIQGKFEPRVMLPDQRVFVVDDIMTSGGTVSECARQCLSVGAGSVHVLVAGRHFQFLEDREYG
jgi:predicted amidophosphoribosyltransferase